MLAIKHRYTSATICEFDIATVREAAEKWKADLRGADLRGADLYDANLYCADLRGADLRGANLYDANLRGADLYCADLRGADLRGADLYDADLYDADLRGADLGEKFGKLRTKGFFSAGPLGSREDLLQAFHTDKGIFVKTVCFFDSLELFREAVIKSYDEYIKAVEKGEE